MVTVSFFMGALLLGTEADRARIYSRTTQAKRRKVATIRGDTSQALKWIDTKGQICLPDGASTPLPSEVSQILLARPIVAIYSLPIQCSHYNHRINEASGGNFEEIRVSGQYAHNDKLLRQNQRSLSVCNLSPNFSWIYSKFREKHVVSKTADRVLGFSLDSNAMTISLPSQKLTTMWRTTRRLAEKTQTSLREISQVLGTMVAHPAILPAPLHYRHLKSTKLYYLSCGYSFDDAVPLYKDIQSDLRWWIQVASSYNGRPLQISHWDLTIESDASKQGWGASCQGTNIGGPWTATELLEHINYLEMKATFLALQSSCTTRSSVSVLLLNRFVCLQDKHPIATVLQLEA